ncbi:MAG: biopolymer transporter ExbD [Candidatus Zixiibacteriota bacterium]|nr:MAG: biopolymer transporter ExbD [candidate division Zixibacteria bacterium]
MRRRHYVHYSSMADINIANLVDVVLVLLIIFMISAPLLQSGIEIELPKTRAAVLNEEAHGVVVSIDDRGGLYIDDVWTRPEAFEKALKAEMRQKGTNSIYLRADSSIAYGVPIHIIARIKEMGIDNIGLVTAYEKKETGKKKK